MDKWIETAIGRMHVNKITQGDVAKKIGIRRDYLSKILNGIQKTNNAEQRVNEAIDAILSDRKNSTDN